MLMKENLISSSNVKSHVLTSLTSRKQGVIKGARSMVNILSFLLSYGNEMLHLRLETRDHQFFRKLFTEVMKHVSSRVLFS